MTGIPLALMRGGTSKGIVVRADDLPVDLDDTAARDDLLARLMGSPDDRQIDGLGGAHPLTSKVAIVTPAGGPDADVDYLFCQVDPSTGRVSTSQTCGNMLAAVGSFAVLRGLVPPADPATDVRVRLLNTGAHATVTVRTPDGRVTFDGEVSIEGVPGTAAPVEIAYGRPATPLLPTGRRSEAVGGLAATLVDAGMPTVLLRAVDLSLGGDESPADLEADPALTDRIAAIRTEAHARMGLTGPAETATTPKIVLISPPADGGTVRTRSFIPRRVHQAIGVLGAASVAAAVHLAGTVADGVARPVRPGQPVRIEHPTGHLDSSVDVTDGDAPVVTAVRDTRTARLLADATAYPAPPRRRRDTSIPDGDH
ncbi:FldA protein [Actinomycetales bacterium JB111]|nr:FldA protein [Actinomycetales bacterium JB111]